MGKKKNKKVINNQFTRFRERREIVENALEQRLLKTRDRMDKLESKVLSRVLGRDTKHLTVGGWECDESPVGLCVYSDEIDEDGFCDGDDWCIFCDQPSGRK